MALSHLAASAPALYDLARKVVIDRKRTHALRSASILGWAGVGVAVGGGLALLLAPRSGAETRARIGESTRRAKEYVSPPSDQIGTNETHPTQ